MYYKHYQRWTKYFPKQQLLVIDGHELRVEPWVSVRVCMNVLLNVLLMSHHSHFRK